MNAYIKQLAAFEFPHSAILKYDVVHCCTRSSFFISLFTKSGAWCCIKFSLHFKVWRAVNSNSRVSSVLFFPIFSYFLQKCYFSYFFLFFTEIPIFSYFSAVFSTFILFFSQKLKEASEIRRISCSGKSHSCEIASLWSFSPK